MRQKNKISQLMAILLLLSTVTFGWEISNELNVHEPVNKKAVEYFIVNFKSEPKYQVASLDEAIQFSGVAWHSGSDQNILENALGIRRRETFQSWVRIGAVDADVSSRTGEKFTYEGKTYYVEKPLRHFYDPIFTPRCLNDMNYLIQPTVWGASAPIPVAWSDPNMDHVTWATTAKDHH